MKFSSVGYLLKYLYCVEIDLKMCNDYRGKFRIVLQAVPESLPRMPAGEYY